jgi:hypothetical protein
MEKDLLGGFLWLDDVKGVGSGEVATIVDFETFNSSEVSQYRGVLDDIAKETGGRVQRTDVTSKNEKIESGIDDERFDRAISTLASAIRKEVPGPGTEASGKVDATE